jgi:hypothetical protein
MGRKMKLNKVVFAASLALFLVACGGGGGGTGGASSGAPGASTTTNNNPLDPVSGVATAGTLTASISGVVYAAPATGASVTAYNVLNDGSNGTSLGTAPITLSNGQFALTLNSVPTGMVRLVATGGTYTSEADSTLQPITTLELVTPYVTTDLNYFVITPVTHIASRALRYRASVGDSLVTAYTLGMNAIRGLSASNQFLTGDARATVNVLKTLPGSASDTLNSYRDLVVGLEWFGVKYNLPSKTVFRIAAANGEAGFPFDGVDTAGAPINVGNWNGAVFDETITRSMDTMMNMPGTAFHELFKPFIEIYMIRDFYLDAACRDPANKPALFARYPGMTAFFGQPTTAQFCTDASARVTTLRGLATTNTRATVMH